MKLTSHAAWQSVAGGIPCTGIVRPAGARAAVGQARAAGQAAPPAINGGLSDVAAISARDAWAVGSTNEGKVVILHWNGATWRRVPSPSPPAYVNMSGVAAVSARNAWAVGTTDLGKSLTLHWNGAAWKKVP